MLLKGLYMVIYFKGMIAGSAGPLPYDMKECLVRTNDIIASANYDYVSPEGFSAKDVMFKCEYRDDRPKFDKQLDDMFKGSK